MRLTLALGQVRRFELSHERWNVGIVTGSVSGIFVLDVDGDDGSGSLRKLVLVEEHSPLPMTLTALTGRGRHLIFRYHAAIRNNQSKLGAGLDVRGDGGYVVAPPSGRAAFLAVPILAWASIFAGRFPFSVAPAFG